MYVSYDLYFVYIQSLLLNYENSLIQNVGFHQILKRNARDYIIKIVSKFR